MYCGVMSAKIVLIDDDRNILLSLSMVLEEEGYIVRTYHDGELGLQGIRAEKPHLVILDVKMPRMDGLEVIRSLRESGDEIAQTPVIFLTSKEDEVDQVLGLRMGADDYVTKPFSQRILLERIRTLLRRAEFQRPDGAPLDSGLGEDRPEKIVRGSLVLDDKRHLSTWKQQTINLTVTEYLLLKTLVLHPGHVKNRDQLIDAAYGDNIFVDDRTIDSHIKRLRKKFKAVDATFNHIETLYGVGYRYKGEHEPKS